MHDSFPSHGSSLAKAVMTRQLGARVAFAIRICSRCTCSCRVRQLMASQLEDGEDAPSSVAAVVICFSSYERFCLFSREVRPVGRGRTFVPGDIQTRIRTVTARPSLLPTSQARITEGDALRHALPREGAIRGFRVPCQEVHRVRSLLSTGKRVGHEKA